jgi:hypothetical protein
MGEVGPLQLIRRNGIAAEWAEGSEQARSFSGSVLLQRMVIQNLIPGRFLRPVKP